MNFPARATICLWTRENLHINRCSNGGSLNLCTVKIKSRPLIPLSTFPNALSLENLRLLTKTRAERRGINKRDWAAKPLEIDR